LISSSNKSLVNVTRQAEQAKVGANILNILPQNNKRGAERKKTI
jgi:hypothetical protein